MKLSIIIINYHSADILNRCINSIESQYSHEIIVIDNDNQLPEISSREVQIIEYAGNLGFSGANNKALQVAQGKYILFLNADVFLSATYIDLCLEILDTNPRCASVQGKLLKEHNPRLIDSTGNVVTRSFWAFNEHHLDHDQPIPDHEIFGVCCAAGIFRRSALDEISQETGLFDEDFFAYLEDVDINIRLRAAGHSSLFVSDATALHIREASSAFWYRFRQSVLNRYLLVIKHKSIISIILNSVTITPIIFLLFPDRKINANKIRHCFGKRKKPNTNNPIKLDSNLQFLKHVVKRLRGSS
jgi:GT2 family glycosyltransferase